MGYKKDEYGKQLWDRFVGGDRSAFAEYYEYNYMEVKAFCYGKLWDDELAATTTNEAFLKMKERYEQQQLSNPNAMLFTVTKNLCLNAIKARNTRKEHEEQAAIARPSPAPKGPDHDLIREDIERAKQAVLDQRDSAIWQQYEDGYHYKEIAEALDIPEGTVKNRITEVRKILRELFQKNKL